MYLDHNAGGRVRAEVAAAIEDALHQPWANPASLHGAGRAARAALEQARDEVARLLGAASSEVVFTGSGTEANNLAVRGIASPGSRVVTTPIEHASVLRSCERSEAEGADLALLAVDPYGRVDAQETASRARGATLLSVGWVNGEIGTVQPVAEIAAELAKLPDAERPLFHSDAVQAAGTVEIDLGSVAIDLLSLSGHKLGAPAGIGALRVRRGVELRPLVVGGPQERERHAGTENLLGIIGFGVAAGLARRERTGHADATRTLREMLWGGLQAAVPGIERLTPPEGAPGTLSVLLPGLRADAVLVALDAEGLSASAGSACAAGAPEPSHVLRALGYEEERAESVLRLSLGGDADAESIAAAIETMGAVVRRARGGAR